MPAAVRDRRGSRCRRRRPRCFSRRRLGRLDLKQGDLATVALSGDYAKPRPALVIQADRFDRTDSVTVLLVTSVVVDAPLIRLAVRPSSENGLLRPSQIMIDKAMTVKRSRLGPAFGQLDDATMIEVDRALTVFLGLVG